MKRTLKRWMSASAMMGFDVRTFARSTRGLAPFIRNLRAFKREFARSGKEFPLGELYPCLGDRFDDSGVASGHYFHQDLWVAQQVFRNNPARHVDVGSRIDGFVAHVASYRPIEVMDIRPLHTTAANITFTRCDLSQPDVAPVDYTDSLSCLHTLEHFGLGRYGDPVDYYGYRRGWDNLHRMLRRGGRLYFSVPIGRRQRVMFDGHRVFSLPFLRGMIDPRYTVEQFAYVDDRGDLVHTTADVPGADETFGLTFGCGIFTLVKR